MSNLNYSIENNFLNGSNDSTTKFFPKSLDEMLKSVGLASWMSIVTTFVLPMINFLGLVGCSLSAWIFFRKKFVDPIFFYYRLLCVINIITLIHNIPAMVLFSPRYFPHVNTWAVAAFKIYYACTIILLFHYSDVLQMGILLTRMKIYSPFVKKHFKGPTHLISIALFLTCFFINIPILFAFKIIYYGDFYYYSDLKQIKISPFFYYGSSEFNESKVGKVLLGFFGLIINLFGSLVAGVTLNIVSYLKYKKYIDKRHMKDEEIQMNSIDRSCVGDSKSKNNPQQTEDQSKSIKKLSQKELNERKAEKNMFHMIITLSFISIVSRAFVILANLYAVFFFSLSNIWTMVVLDYFIYALVPSLSILIFYAFNKMFRKEFKSMFWHNQKKTSGIHSSLHHFA